MQTKIFISGLLNRIVSIDNKVYITLKKIPDNVFLNYISFAGNIVICTFLSIILYFVPIEHFKNISILSFCALIINTIIVFIFKYSFKRQRLDYKSKGIFIKKFDPYSFPSGHVSRLSGFIIPALLNPYLVIFFFLITVIAALSRISRGYHHFSDCVAGFIIGLAGGFISSLLFNLYFIKLLAAFIE